MGKQQVAIISILLFLSIGIGLYQYVNNLMIFFVDAVAVGTPNPGHSLASIECSSGSLCIDTVNNRVGIGTSSPSQKLEIIGDAKITGNTSISGNLGVGTVAPSVKLEVSGNILAGDVCTTEGVCLSQLANSNKLLVNSVHTYWQCMALGGTVRPSDVASPLCQFTGTACPSGWTAYKNFGTTSEASYGAHGGWASAAAAVAGGQQSGWCCSGPLRYTSRDGFVDMALQCTGSWYAGSSPWSEGCDICAFRASLCQTWTSRGCY